ncbi:ATPase AAA [Bacteroidia bacterium]|nr:ATPase AAA [Bacteroidia bacterium]
MKNLPIGIQSFKDLREKNYLYVDKTESIYRLITSGKAYFLSRPRRFGKSLLVSTLEALFKGQKELFEGLWIDDKVDWTKLNYPVIRFDFGQTTNTAAEELTDSLFCFLTNTASNYDIVLENTGLPSMFAELISKLHQSVGQQAVVLIDEYDKAILDNMLTPEVMEENKKVLHGFFQVMKAADEHLRFVFLTGVSKFSGVTIFSGLNNLNDITLVDKYATICGYTQEELETNFADYLIDLGDVLGMSHQDLLDAIREWYDGYSWDGKTAIYNPFSTLCLFENKRIANYWFRTGTPTFLVELLKQRNQLTPILEPVILDDSAFGSFDPQNISEIPLLFQTGYLTIKHRKLIQGMAQYTIEMPNLEVKESLLRYLLSAYSSFPVEQEYSLRLRMQKQLFSHDASGLEKSLREMLAYVPYQLHIGKEAYYHSLFLLWLKLLGFDVAGEVNTNNGRIDAVWQLPEHTIIVEIKYQVQEEDTSQLLDVAIHQIREKHYAERFDTGVESRHATSLLAVAFAGKNIACRIESL